MVKIDASHIFGPDVGRNVIQQYALASGHVRAGSDVVLFTDDWGNVRARHVQDGDELPNGSAVHNALNGTIVSVIILDKNV